MSNGGMDSYFKENNWTGSSGQYGLRAKGPSPQAKRFLIILHAGAKLQRRLVVPVYIKLKNESIPHAVIYLKFHAI